VRSPAEISFRLRQEVVNLARFVTNTSGPLRTPLQPHFNLPDPAISVAAVKGTAAADEIVTIAKEVMAHRFPIFGTVVDTGPEIDWRRDYRSGKTSGSGYFRRIPYLDFNAVGDHKWTWELNRHQHLIVLAQAFSLTGERNFLGEIEAQLASWTQQNPFVRGINWASALEVAFRALSWIWVDHLVGRDLKPTARLMLQNGLWLHAKHLEANLSTYFSPNTHLLGEAVALHAIGVGYPEMPGAGAFAKSAGSVVEEQLRFQMREDGSHFEQSTYYDVYAVDFFLFHYLMAGRPRQMNTRLAKMAEYLHAIMGPSRRLFLLGDDDGGRLFFPYGTRNEFGRATLATCAALLPDVRLAFDKQDTAIQTAWWVAAEGQSAQTAGSARSSDSGLISFVHGSVQVIFDAGPFGWSGAGHSHADTLQILIRRGDRAILDDAGTFVYTAGASERNWFRGTAAHNTVVIDHHDQAIPVTPFRWENKPTVHLDSASTNFADARCEYAGFIHRRTVLLCGARACVVLDRISGPSGTHTVEQVWNGEMQTSAQQSKRNAWRSECYGSRTESTQTVASLRGELPMVLAAAHVFESADTDTETLSLASDSAGCTVSIAGVTARFPLEGEPSWSVSS
jgi:hypothetical protein